MIRHDMPQRSPEWFAVRLGIPTSSSFDKIVTPKGKLSDQCRTLMYALLAEWMTGAPLDDPTTQWMQRGADLEDQAFKSYEFETNTETEKVGFITTDDGLLGCSPDRLVIGAPGGVELKCPSLPVHVGHMVERKLDQKHYPQVQGQCLIAELQWVNIQSYFPGLPSVIIRCNRDDAYIALLSDALAAFTDTMLAAREKLTQQYGPFVRRELKKPDEFSGMGVSDEDARAIWRASQEGTL